MRRDEGRTRHRDPISVVTTLRGVRACKGRNKKKPVHGFLPLNYAVKVAARYERIALNIFFAPLVYPTHAYHQKCTAGKDSLPVLVP